MISLMDLMGQQREGPYTVAAPLADMGLRRGGIGRRLPYMPTAPFGIPGHPQSTGGYDSSGINPHGMYTGGAQRFPANPGGFMAMMGRY